MLGLDRHLKYRAGSIERLAELLALTTSPAVARTRLFGWLVFNAVLETRAFDQDRWPQAIPLAWPILGEDDLVHIDRAHLLNVAEALGIKRSLANAQRQRIQERIIAETDALLVATEQENVELSADRPELRATFASEMRCLRMIRALVAEQADRLR